jgi:hypothetical protein
MEVVLPLLEAPETDLGAAALANGDEAEGEAEAGSQSATDSAVVTGEATGLVAAAVVAAATPFSLSTAVRLACTL